MRSRVRQSGTDRKWDELSRLLQNNSEMFDADGHRRKLVIFTEHRDTLNYLAERIRALLGRPEAVVTIHGGIGREDRRKAQEAFTHDKEVEILVATDAAGEGINLQRAHLMVNYDLPWNPNRLEQRFGRIHRIGQTEVCHLWNLVAKDTREGEVYHRLLEKLDEERKALGGQVFDVLGQLTFDDRPLRDLLLDAIRYGDQPEVKARLFQVVDKALDRQHLRELVEGRALTHDSMDVTRVRQIREDMERAEARRLQPHFIASFFLEAFKLLGGTIHEREPKRYEIKHVPAVIRNRDREIGRGEAVLHALRAHHLREGPDQRPRQAAGRLRLPRPSAARRHARPHHRAPPRPAQARRHPRRRHRRGRPAARPALPGTRHPGRPHRPRRQPPRRLQAAAIRRNRCRRDRPSTPARPPISTTGR